MMADTAEQRLQNVIAQEAERQRALLLLASLRQEAASEIDRLIAFLDASDDYVMTEHEQDIGADDREAEDEHDEPSLGWTEREAGKGRYGGLSDREMDRADDEPSLGAIERHPSIYQQEGRSSIGHQLDWAAGNRDDREDEHDGCEPGEDDEPDTDREPLLGWTEAGSLSGSGELEGTTSREDLEAACERYSPAAAAGTDDCVWFGGRPQSGAAAKALRDLQKLNDR